MLSDKIINLNQDHILGVGYHKTTYIHPNNDALCIKVPFSQNDIDLKRELTYRKVREKRGQSSTLLPTYYGTTLTNKGEGHIFERVHHYNGKNSISLKEFLVLHQQEGDNTAFTEALQKMLSDLKKTWFAEKIVTSDTDPVNFMVQEINPSQYVIRIVDNIGTPVLIPFAFYFDFIAEKRVRRYWARFLKSLIKLLPSQIDRHALFKDLY